VTTPNPKMKVIAPDPKIKVHSLHNIKEIDLVMCNVQNSVRNSDP
jgi:hypothetical protein